MKIKSINISGFKNLRDTHLQFEHITAIISLNNYGKSNLLEAIDFAIDFLNANTRERKQMMQWTRGIPINTKNAGEPFVFEIELDNEESKDYRFIRYGFSFSWYRDDGTGQRILDEKIEARNSESIRYTSYLKRKDGKYRKGKNAIGFRKIILGDSQLAIDILSALDDIELYPLISSIKNINYFICNSLDLKDCYQGAPLEYMGKESDESFDFDDNDVPKAVYMLKTKFPEKYELFKEAVYTLFPEFINISVQSFELQKEKFEIIVTSGNKDMSISPDDIPFRIRDEVYRLIITTKYLNQPLNMSMMSTGTKRIIWLLINVFSASSRKITFIGIEELETSIHPRMLKKLLEVLDEALDDTVLIISSHSPFLVQYLKVDRLYLGVPSTNGVASFKKIKHNKERLLIESAHANELSVGEFLFELMSGDNDSDLVLSNYLED